MTGYRSLNDFVQRVPFATTCPPVPSGEMIEEMPRKDRKHTQYGSVGDATQPSSTGAGTSTADQPDQSSSGLDVVEDGASPTVLEQKDRTSKHGGDGDTPPS